MITLSRSIYRLGQSVCGFSNCKFSVFSIVNARSPSQNQWIQRQTNDFFTREAKLRQYKSRAAFKLLEIDKKYKLFKSGMTVVDLGFAPGAWSQVAVEKTSPNGKIVGVDILFATPPEGVTAIQGNFLTKSVQDEVHRLVCDPHLGRRIPKGKILISDEEDVQQQQREVEMGNDSNDETEQSIDGEEIHRRDLELNMARTAIDLEKETVQKSDNTVADDDKESSPLDKYNVDVVLSDMCAPIFQNSGFWLRSVNDPFVRMANTSGLAVRDHGASIVSEKDLGSFI